MVTVRLNVTLLPPVPRHARIEMRLDRYDVDGAIQVPTAHICAFDENGHASLELWPNERGVRDSQYHVRITSPAGTLLASRVTVPDCGSIDLRELLRDEQSRLSCE